MPNSDRCTLISKLVAFPACPVMPLSKSVETSMGKTMPQQPGSKNSHLLWCHVVGKASWTSVFSPCEIQEKQSKLIAAMRVHVDDTALGGDLSSQVFRNALTKLKARFPYRKWRVQSGEFCGAWYTQRADKSIHMSMQSFAERIRPVNVPKGVPAEDPLNDSQIKVLRAVNGSLNWLSSQGRPDLSVQTSMSSQQSFPRPTIKTSEL